MEVYIKGMEMPESCYYCPFADGVWQKNKRCLINGKEMPRDGRNVQQNHLTCPLIPVPPHGRLIDADALFEEAYKVWGFDADADDCSVLMQLINDAPTIIPADKDGETWKKNMRNVSSTN